MLNYVNSFNTLWGMVDLKLYSVFQKTYVCKLRSLQPMGAAWRSVPSEQRSYQGDT